MGKKKSNLNKKAVAKKQKFAAKNESAEQTAKKLLANQSKQSVRELLKALITVELMKAHAVNNFMDGVKNHITQNPTSALSRLSSNLPELGIQSLKEFFDELGLIKFLTTNYDPKGRNFEVFVLKNRKMRLFLTRLAESSWKTMKEIKSKVTNIKGKNFDVDKFDKIDFEIAEDFKTHPDNQLFHDFGLVKYDPKTKELFLISGEIKEPSAAKELPEQFSNRENRIAPSKAYKSKQISFIWKGERITVDSENVFLLRDDSVGIARLKNDSSLPKAPDINFKSIMFEITDFQPKLTKGNTELFFKWMVKVNPDFSPDKLVKELRMIKKRIPKIQK